MDRSHLPVVRLSEVVRVRGASLGAVHPQCPSHLLDVPGLWHERGHLFSGGFRVGVWRTPVLGMLEQEIGNPGSTCSGRCLGSLLPTARAHLAPDSEKWLLQIGIDAVFDMGMEFWPDINHHVF